ncbi:MAG: PorP/SprF family type IX secretion system membrane protein [Bacteroidota bacterium]
MSKPSVQKLKRLLFAAMLVSGTACAQDVQFTQYLTSPLTLNPAMTGLASEDFRLAGNFRMQSSSAAADPYMTGTLSYDMAILKSKLPKGDAFGIGVVALYDVAGTGDYKNTTAGLSVAYHKAIGAGQQHHVSAGFQAMLVKKEVELFHPITFQPVNSTLSYTDYNLGIMYSGKISKRVSAYMGHSYYHLTQPVETYPGDNEHTIHARHTTNLGGSFDLNARMVLYASALYQTQASATELLVGSSLGFALNKNPQKSPVLYLGGWYRYGDAICPYLGMGWAKMRVGLSYDIFVSDFTPAISHKGALELSLIYSGGIKKHVKNPLSTWTCPRMF